MAVLRRILTGTCAVTLLLGGASTTPARAATSSGAAESVLAGPALPADDVGETVVDAAHGHVLITTPSAGTITVTDLDGTLVRRVTGLPGVAKLLLTADATVLAAVPGADVVVRLRASDLQEQSRTATGSDTCPTALAQAGGKLWLSYGCGFWRSGSGATGGAVAPITLAPAVTLPAVQPYDDPPLLTSSPAFPDDLVVAGTSNNTATFEVRDVSGAAPYVQARRQHSFLREMHISPDGHQLVTADSGPYVDTYALPHLDVVRTKEKGCTFALAPGGRQKALGTCGGFDRLVAVPTGSPYPTHGLALRGRQNGLAYSPDGTLYAVGEAVGQTTVSGPPPGTAVFVVRGWQHDPLDLQVRADRDRFGTGGAVHLSGRVQSTDDTAPGRAPLVLTRSGPEGTTTLASAAQDASGGFTASDTPPTSGGYTYRVRADGDAVHAGALAEAEVQVGERSGTRPRYPAQQGVFETSVLPDGADGFVVDDVHRRVFVGGSSSPVQVLDFDGHVVTRLPVSGRVVSLSRDSTTLLVAPPGSGLLDVVDTASLALVAQWPAGYRDDRVLATAGLPGQLVVTAEPGVPYQEDGCQTLTLGRPTHVDPLVPCDGGQALAVPPAEPATVYADAGSLQRFELVAGRLHQRAELGGDSIDPSLSGMFADALASSHDGRRLVLKDLALDTSYLGGVDTSSPSATHPGDRYPGSAPAFSPDDRYVASVVPQAQPDPPHENSLALTAAGSGAPVWVGLGLDRLRDGPRFSADGSRLFVLTERRTADDVQIPQMQVLHDPLGGLDGAPVPPGGPRDVTAAAASTSTSVRWTAPWHDGGADITGYTVTARPSGARVDVGAGARSAVLPLTAALQIQTISVVARNDAGAGAPASAQAPADELAPAPNGLRVSRDADGAARVVWDDVFGPYSGFEAPSGPAVPGYLLRASPGGSTYRYDTRPGPPQLLPPGLQPGTAYTFTVASTTARGDGLPSPPGPPITPSAGPAATAPSAARAVRAVSAAGAAEVGWAEAGDNGSALTRYTVTASPGGRTATTTGATQVRVTGLTPGTAYTFTVTATNAVGPARAARPRTPSSQASSTTSSRHRAPTRSCTSATSPPGRGAASAESCPTHRRSSAPVRRPTTSRSGATATC